MIQTFTFAVNSETGEATFAGNIEIGGALQLLQALVVSDGIRKGLAQERLEREKRNGEEKKNLPSEVLAKGKEEP